MALRAKRDQVLWVIISALAPKLHVMHLQVSRSSAELAAPPVALEHLLAEIFVVI